MVRSLGWLRPFVTCHSMGFVPVVFPTLVATRWDWDRDFRVLAKEFPVLGPSLLATQIWRRTDTAITVVVNLSTVQETQTQRSEKEKLLGTVCFTYVFIF